MQLFDCEYMRSYMAAQVLFENNFNNQGTKEQIGMTDGKILPQRTQRSQKGFLTAIYANASGLFTGGI